MPRLLSACDVGCLSSVSEAFPLSLVEMMACGLPCAATDAGDSARIIADTGQVVPPANPTALAGALTALLQLAPDARQALGGRARQRAEQHYSIEHMARAYADLYAAVLDERA
jgi:glycosyltransferase involved in cell wall biosynthesis